MTIYFIYKKGEFLTDSVFLYAITDKKFLKDSFMEERKKNLFVVKKHEVSKDEFIKIKSKHGQLFLVRRGFRTSHTIGEIDTVYITVTFAEEMDVFTNSDKVILEIAKYTDYISRAFNKELLSALNTLEYFNIQKFSNNNDQDWFLRGVSDYETFDFRNADIRIDEFSLFLYFYGHTFDYDKILKMKG